MTTEKRFPLTIQHTTSVHYPSHSPPHTAIAAQSSERIRYNKARGESGIAEESAHKRCSSAPEVIPRSWWSSTPATTTTSVHPSLRQESHSDSHSSNVTEMMPPLNRLQCIGLPSQSDSNTAVILHSSLLCPRRAGIYLDLSEPREIVGKVLEERWDQLRDLATHPAIPSLTVVHTWLPWPITVHASGMDARGVTIADVLVTISRDLATVVDETRKRRMSFLRGGRMFLGLRTCEIGGDIWEPFLGSFLPISGRKDKDPMNDIFLCREEYILGEGRRIFVDPRYE